MTASARGLFRATGKKAKPVVVLNGKDLAGEVERAEFLEREADDFYPTPPEPTQALISAELDRLRQFPVIWEPAAGDGAMAREMRRCGLEVVCSDLIDRGCNAELRSFYEYTEAPANALVTNPPFKECNGNGPWVWHALEKLGLQYMALLLPLNWTGAGKDRARLWAEYPPARVYIMRWRVDFTGQGAPPMLNAWFVWDSQHTGETVLRMLDKTDPNQSQLFGDAA